MNTDLLPDLKHFTRCYLNSPIVCIKLKLGEGFPQDLAILRQIKFLLPPTSPQDVITRAAHRLTRLTSRLRGTNPAPRSPARTDPSLLFGPTAPDLTPPGSHELHYPPCRFPRTLTSRYTPITRPHFLVAPQHPAPLRVSIMATRALSLVRA